VCYPVVEAADHLQDTGARSVHGLSDEVLLERSVTFLVILESDVLIHQLASLSVSTIALAYSIR
jgi:hypothetical protein